MTPKEYNAEWHRKNRDRVNARERARYAASPERRMLKDTKHRARKKGIPFNLTIEDIVIPSICPVFGIPFVPNSPYSASIDKIEPSKGYVKGNIQIISSLANSMKSNATLEQLRKFGEWAIKQ